jgi:hypothetical protein
MDFELEFPADSLVREEIIFGRLMAIGNLKNLDHGAPFGNRNCDFQDPDPCGGRNSTTKLDS